MKALYQKVDKFWHDKVIGPDWSPFVVLWLMLGSECPICSMWRGVFLGMGFYALLSGKFLLGIALISLVGVLAWAERTFGEQK